MSQHRLPLTQANRWKPTLVRTLVASRFAADELLDGDERPFHWDYDRYYRDASLDEIELAPGEQAGIWLRLFNYCNNRCVFCPDPHVESGRAHLPSVIENLRVLADKGVRRITVSGGEPTLEPRLVPLLQAIREFGYAHINLSTNARRLADPDYCAAILASGVTEFFISVQGYDTRSGDDINGAPGSFDETLQALANIRRQKRPEVGVTLNHVVTSLDVAQLDRVAAIAIDMGADAMQFSMLEQYVGGELNKSLIPRFADLRAGLAKALPILVAAGIEPVLEGIPPCVYPGYERFYLDYRRARASNLRIQYHTAVDRDLILFNRGSIREIAHLYGDACDDCDARRACSGVYYSYFHSHDAGDLVPLRLARPTQNAASAAATEVSR